MSKAFVLDSSAVLAVIFKENGTGTVIARLADACISAVNLAEVITKLVASGSPEKAINDTLDDLELTVIPFTEALAHRAGLLRASTRHLGLSLGDRACLALAEDRGATAVTADRTWQEVEGSAAVLCIR